MGFTNPVPALEHLLVKVIKLSGSGKLGPGEHTIDGTPVKIDEDGTIHTIVLTGIAIRRPYMAQGGLRSNFSMELPILEEGSPKVVNGTISQSVDGFRARIREDADESEDMLPGAAAFDDPGW